TGPSFRKSGKSLFTKDFFQSLTTNSAQPAVSLLTEKNHPSGSTHVQGVLRHVDTAKREHGHLRIPSLLMRARALATVRVWKKRPEHQAHSRSDIRDACGLPVATGAEL